MTLLASDLTPHHTTSFCCCSTREHKTQLCLSVLEHLSQVVKPGPVENQTEGKSETFVPIQEEEDAMPQKRRSIDRIETKVYSTDPADWNISLYVKVPQRKKKVLLV